MHSKMPLCLLLIILLGSVEEAYAQRIKTAPVNNGDNDTQVWTRIMAEAFDVGKEMLGRA